MRLTLAVVAVVIVNMVSVAHATTLSYTQPISVGYSPQSFGDQIKVVSQDFDPSLGSLTAVSFTIVGSETDNLVGENGNNIPFSATFSNYIDAYGDGFKSNILGSEDAGYASTYSASNSFHINQTFSESSSLTFYQVSGTNEFDFDAYSTVSNSQTGQHVYYSDDDAQFSGSVTETFTYTSVPEPGSLPIFAGATLALLGFAGRKRFSFRRC